MQELAHAFPDRKSAAQAEEHERHHEGPEVHVAAMAESVGAIWWTLTQPQAQEEADLVPVSATEWNVSATMAALPVDTAATPFITARAALPSKAAMTAVRDSAMP